ncbi:hypothetical protein ABZ924_11495 [Streptomyces sp. NPDC046876]|uniref:hypothetical protein n=1 Tax=Streptomyces sp. NPDC046876 TaxID=3155616 RepID=UPI00340493D5
MASHRAQQAVDQLVHRGVRQRVVGEHGDVPPSASPLRALHADAGRRTAAFAAAGLSIARPAERSWIRSTPLRP